MTPKEFYLLCFKNRKAALLFLNTLSCSDKETYLQYNPPHQKQNILHTACLIDDVEFVEYLFSNYIQFFDMRACYNIFKMVNTLSIDIIKIFLNNENFVKFKTDHEYYVPESFAIEFKMKDVLELLVTSQLNDLRRYGKHSINDYFKTLFKMETQLLNWPEGFKVILELIDTKITDEEIRDLIFTNLEDYLDSQINQDTANSFILLLDRHVDMLKPHDRFGDRLNAFELMFRYKNLDFCSAESKKTLILTTARSAFHQGFSNVKKLDQRKIDKWLKCVQKCIYYAIERGCALRLKTLFALYRRTILELEDLLFEVPESYHDYPEFSYNFLSQKLIDSLESMVEYRIPEDLAVVDILVATGFSDWSLVDFHTECTFSVISDYMLDLSQCITLFDLSFIFLELYVIEDFINNKEN